MSATSENIGRIADNHIKTALLESVFELVLKIKSPLLAKIRAKIFFQFFGVSRNKRIAGADIVLKRWEFSFLRQNFKQ